MWAKFLRLDSGIRKQFQREPKSDFVTEKKTLSSQKKNSKLNREKKKKNPDEVTKRKTLSIAIERKQISNKQQTEQETKS